MQCVVVGVCLVVGVCVTLKFGNSRLTDCNKNEEALNRPNADG